MAAGERVLALEEEGAGQLQARAHQAGPERQHAPQGGDGGIEEERAGLVVEPFTARRREARPAGQEQQGEIVGPGLQRGLQQLQRRRQPPGAHQGGRPGGDGLRGGGFRLGFGCGFRCRFRLGEGRRGGESRQQHNRGDDRKTPDGGGRTKTLCHPVTPRCCPGRPQGEPGTRVVRHGLYLWLWSPALRCAPAGAARSVVGLKDVGSGASVRSVREGFKPSPTKPAEEPCREKHAAGATAARARQKGSAVHRGP